MTPFTAETVTSSGMVKSRRRVIGPIPPRRADGRLAILPILSKRLKLNQLGEPCRDAKGELIEQNFDQRHPSEYALFEQGAPVDPEAIKGLRTFAVDISGEPLLIVYAKDEAHALTVAKAEWGIKRLHHEIEPKVTPYVEAK